LKTLKAIFTLPFRGDRPDPKFQRSNIALDSPCCGTEIPFMHNVEVQQFSTSHELAHTAAARWIDLAAATNKTGAAQLVALSGGRIAHEFFKAVTHLSRAGGVPFLNVHFFWADERCVPPSDPESNFRIADELLFTPLGIAPGKIHRLRGEIDPAEAAAMGSEDLRRMAARDALGYPVLDLIFLGMGEDGHVASLFPGAPEEIVESREPYVAVIGPKPPPQRLTLTYGVLTAAREVWVLVSGSGKEKALEQSLATGGTTPLSRVLQRRKETMVLTDLKRAEVAGEAAR
jgi:6-phosphogluconolactonase